MEKRDATWKNIDDVLDGIKDDMESAETFATDAANAADSAYHQLTKLKKLIKIRKEYDEQISEPWFDKTDLANEFVKLIESKFEGKKSSI